MVAQIGKRGTDSPCELPNRITRTLDSAGAAASLACAIHCIALPIATALLPVLGLAWLDNPWVDRLFLATALVLAALAHPKGYQRHRRCLPAAVAACGLIGISLAISFWEDAPFHHYLISFGGLLLASSHFLNRHWCKCACHEES